VPTLTGTVKLKVPPGTQPGDALRVRGRGLPRCGGGRRGDLYIRAPVRIPEDLSPEEKKLDQKLHELHSG
jgi:DnaJ-class molecular chaperone